MSDTAACLDWRAKQPQAKAGQIGVVGYCMGGGMALRVAATFADRIAACALFHAGNLATDAEDSPHRLARQIRAKVLAAGADEDPSFDLRQCERLDRALKDAGLDAKVAIWKGLKHGWVPDDMPVHDAAGAERHWTALLELFDEVLND